MKQIKDFVQFKKQGGFDELRSDITEALQKVAAEYGVVISTGATSYTNSYADIKLHVGLVAKNGLVETRESKEFTQFAESMGLQLTDLNRSFMFKGLLYKVIGLRTGRKHPILCQREDGKRFFFALEAVKTSLKHYAK